MKFWNLTKTSNDEGVLELDGPISQETWWGDEVTPKQFKDDLKALGNIKNLIVKINSGGGDVFAATTIYSALKEHPANVIAKIDGLAASAATIISMAADEIQIPTAAIMMIHNPSVFLFGGYEGGDLQKLSETLDTIKDSIIESYLSKVSITKDELVKMMDEETWMTGREAVEKGFADTLLYDKVSAAFENNMLIMNSVTHDVSKLHVPTRIVNDIKSYNKPPSKADNTHGKEKEKVEIKNKGELKAQYPDLVNQIISDAVDGERERLKAIDSISDNVPSEMLNKAKYDEPVSAEKLSLQVLALNKTAGITFANNLKNDLQNNGAEDIENDSDDHKQEDQEVKAVNGLAAALKNMFK